MMKMIKASLVAAALTFGGVAVAYADGIGVSVDHSTTVNIGKDVAYAHKAAIDAALDGQNVDVSGGDAHGGRVGDSKVTTSTNVKAHAPLAAVLEAIGN